MWLNESDIFTPQVGLRRTVPAVCDGSPVSILLQSQLIATILCHLSGNRQTY